MRKMIEEKQEKELHLDINMKDMKIYLLNQKDNLKELKNRNKRLRSKMLFWEIIESMYSKNKHDSNFLQNKINPISHQILFLWDLIKSKLLIQKTKKNHIKINKLQREVKSFFNIENKENNNSNFVKNSKNLKFISNRQKIEELINKLNTSVSNNNLIPNKLLDTSKKIKKKLSNK